MLNQPASGQRVLELMLTGRQNGSERTHAKDEVAEPSCEVLMQHQ